MYAFRFGLEIDQVRLLATREDTIVYSMRWRGLPAVLKIPTHTRSRRLLLMASMQDEERAEVLAGKRRSLEHEARAAATVSGAGGCVPRPLAVVSLASDMVPGGWPGLVSERIDGHTLESEAARRGDVPWALSVGADLAHTLAVAHAANWTHGDVSGSNAIVQPDGRAMLIDWEGAVETDDMRARTSDVYALVVLLRWMLDGRPAPPLVERMLGVLDVGGWPWDAPVSARDLLEELRCALAAIGASSTDATSFGSRSRRVPAA